MNGTRCAISVAMKATSRLKRSSLATSTAHLAFLAGISAIASCGRLPSASAPLPVSISMNSPMISKPSAAANATLAARCASRPRPDLP
jgi:hypothetical protein